MRPGTHHPSSAAFTLLEILTALALFAVIAAAAAPLLISAFDGSEADKATAAVENAALSAHDGALATGRRKILRLSPTGLVPGDALPEGWTLEVRRMSDPRFRAPRAGEVWEFNGAGICEPLALRLSARSGSLELKFDALTAQTIDEE